MNYWIVILFAFSIGTSQELGYVDSTKVKNPSMAWKLGVIPGLGQIYNGKYVKAIGFMVAELFVVSRFIELKEANKIGLRNTYAWWTFGLFVWNMLDAYVDAQLSTFPVRRLESTNDIDSLKVKLN
jgi:hypothetical protein